MTCLVLPPEHPKFPAVPVLHAICALASQYTGMVSSPPPTDYTKVPLHEMFTHKYRHGEGSELSFGDRQAELARETAQHLESIGSNLLQVVQANVLLSYYYCSHARSAELFLTAAHSLRLSVPLKLNVCPPFLSITKTISPDMFPAARTVIEDETRRNTFWLAYTIERLHGSSNGWAHCIDDQDIFQLLPVCHERFQRGHLVTPSQRQWSHSRDLLLTNPEDQVDPFVLYVKTSIITSKVKGFNMRFRARHFAGDESVIPVNSVLNEPIDPRDTRSFIELDRIISDFHSTIPSHLQHPIQRGVVDCILVAVMAIPHLAMIVLHEPHANLCKEECISAQKMLRAARAIVDLIYELWSTSFDLSLLESFMSAPIFQAGRVLGGFLLAIESEVTPDALEHSSILQSQIQVCRSALEQMAQRHALAGRFVVLIDEMLAKALHVGPAA
ncbi:hypothetical protein V5O48_002881 [Marasmius crinis-equi]|uniref:Xylanolytic transcriptional activator regulatory domain-containing protein n=1 Tax=Marasmius crinis-equi TaxID=585013 RepID=A0ABR3FUB6_9AGAR